MVKKVSAIDMAKEARIEPKRFRRALRKEEFNWHPKHGRWTVDYNSAEHREMKRVLNQITSK